MNRNVYKAMLIALNAVLLTCVTAQTRGMAQHVPGTINGRLTPDLVPDNVAYRFVLLSVRLPDNPTTDALNVQRARMKMIGLSDLDKAIMREVVANLKIAYSQWQQANANVVVQSIAQRDLMRKEQDGIVQQARDALSIRLSLLGQFQWEAYVRKAKSRMFVLP